MWENDDAATPIVPEALLLKDLAPDMVTCGLADPDQDDFPNPDPFPADAHPLSPGGGDKRFYEP